MFQKQIGSGLPPWCALRLLNVLGTFILTIISWLKKDILVISLTLIVSSYNLKGKVKNNKWVWWGCCSWVFVTVEGCRRGSGPTHPLSPRISLCDCLYMSGLDTICRGRKRFLFFLSLSLSFFKIRYPGISLVVQWLRIYLEMQRARVWCPVRELRSYTPSGQNIFKINNKIRYQLPVRKESVSLAL